ncbi:MAG: hypothetical protein LAO78_28200 [Acidobacteriia bacterium]|nr:hypothetical protein [Terriglobia bacterium]
MTVRPFGAVSLPGIAQAAVQSSMPRNTLALPQEIVDHLAVAGGKDPLVSG